MKFSYSLLKKLVPDLPAKEDVINTLNLFIFEAENGGDGTLEVSVPANRFSSASGHWGLAWELAAVYHKKYLLPNLDRELGGGKPNFTITVETDQCRRLISRYFDSVVIKPSPKWMQETLVACGVRPINNIVDITNYVMLETGQPLHAFEYAAVEGGQLRVRHASHGEVVTTLDGKQYRLTPQMMVIADTKKPLDIAGIKGGKEAEISEQTTRMFLTAGNFDGAAIYNTSRALGLVTDASMRNAHNLSPALAEIALERASQLIAELGDGRPGPMVDNYPRKAPRRVLKFNIDKCNALTGLQLKETEACSYLKRLGFDVTGPAGKKRVAVPPLRDDIERFEDLVEEVIRLFGYNKLPAQPPHVPLQPSGFEEEIHFKDKIKRLLVRFGLTEIYSYSFVGNDALAQTTGEFFGLAPAPIANPISSEYTHLRPSLAPGLIAHAKDNLRFFQRVRLFEIGHIFLPEKQMAGVIVAGPPTRGGTSSAVQEVKGIVDQLLEELGIVDRHYPDLNFEMPLVHQGESLRIESDHQVIGYLGTVRGSGGGMAVAELDMGKIMALAVGEKEYEPASKYPSIMRDISLLVPRHIRVNRILELIEAAAPHYLDDVDVIDFYENDRELGENFKSLTFRLVFLADDRTLTDKEVEKEVERVTSALIRELGVEIR